MATAENFHQPANFYQAVGGEPTFRKLVEAFYAGVAEDPVLRPLYPDEDLGPAAERLRMFLIQYWGGPNTYSQLRGHPRLRMRHAPFSIGPRQRDAWLRRMRAAVDELDLAPEHAATLWDYLQRAAMFMVNTLDDEEPNVLQQTTLVVQPVDERDRDRRGAVDELDQ